MLKHLTIISKSLLYFLDDCCETRVREREFPMAHRNRSNDRVQKIFVECGRRWRIRTIKCVNDLSILIFYHSFVRSAFRHTIID